MTLLMEVSKKQIQDRYLELHQIYGKTSKRFILVEAEQALMIGDYDKAETLMTQLDSKEVLLDRLYQNIKGKPVHNTLKRMLSGKTKNAYENLKGLFSLGTHICIELEKGNMEYRVLLDETLDNIQRTMMQES